MSVTYQRLNRAGLRRAQESVRAVFEQATLIRSYQPRIIPGLLQTAGYTTVMLEISRDRQGTSRDDISAAVAERMDRQRILTQAEARLEFVIEEQVLRYRTCATEILREQLRHLHEISRLAQVTLGIIPQRADRHRVLPSEGFVMFDTGLVIVELVSGVLSVTQPREIAMYARDFADLAGIAVHGRAARDLISTALHELARRRQTQATSLTHRSRLRSVSPHRTSPGQVPGQCRACRHDHGLRPPTLLEGSGMSGSRQLNQAQAADLGASSVALTVLTGRSGPGLLATGDASPDQVLQLRRFSEICRASRSSVAAPGRRSSPSRTGTDGLSAGSSSELLDRLDTLLLARLPPAIR